MLREMSNDELSARRQNIISLVTVYYDRNPFLKEKKYDLNDLINKALDKYLHSDLSMNEIEEEIIKEIYRLKNDLENTNYKDGQHNNITKKKDSKIENVLRDLNSAHIDYFITGLAVSSLVVDKAIPDDNLSLYINDEDFDKFKVICENNGLNFIDKRENPNRTMENGNVTGEPNISASTSDGLTNMAAVDFERLSDGSIITKDNYLSSDGAHFIKADFYGKELSNEAFDTNKVSIEDNNYPIVAPEFEFVTRLNSNSPDDREVVNKLENHVDVKRIERIQALAINNYASQVTKAEPVKKQNNDLSAMLSDESQIVDTYSVQKEKPKQLVKNNTGNTQSSNANNGGYLSQLTFIFLMLLITVMFLTGFLLLNM